MTLGLKQETFDALWRWVKIVGVLATGLATWATLTAGVRDLENRVTVIETQGSAPLRVALDSLNQRVGRVEQKQDIGNYLLCRIPPVTTDSECRPNPRPPR